MLRLYIHFPPDNVFETQRPVLSALLARGLVHFGYLLVAPLAQTLLYTLLNFTEAHCTVLITLLNIRCPAYPKHVQDTLVDQKLDFAWRLHEKGDGLVWAPRTREWWREKDWDGTCKTRDQLQDDLRQSLERLKLEDRRLEDTAPAQAHYEGKSPKACYQGESSPGGRKRAVPNLLRRALFGNRKPAALKLSRTSYIGSALLEGTGELRDAFRALKGAVLRQEVFAEDGSSKKENPYTIAEMRFAVDLL
ncbi:hypothetical protein H2199_009002 [Coniosporium tulheliwenetii]|uniref:Uncharacterized protein n=1 Tax=Coniosporium tulheliwenetii TaxID=3383036 RepID=A0ACC2YGV7_9PEZI|nr:hypothetical protein H2199_009002 [Cladosporium sp. JES 115]